jgi:hypothetical protein
MFEQTFKNIDDILHKDAGCGSELDYVEAVKQKLMPNKTLKMLRNFFRVICRRCLRMENGERKN